MNQLIKRIFGFSIFSSIVFLILGMFLVFRTEGTINLISSIIGIILLLNGGFSLINYLRGDVDASYRVELIYGIIAIVAGFVLILNPTAIISVLPFILGIYFVISGIIKLKYAIEIKDNKAKAPIYSMIVSILMILCGILFIVNPFEGAIAITQIIGIFLIVYACLDIINYCCIRKDLKEIKRIFRS